MMCVKFTRLKRKTYMMAIIKVATALIVVSSPSIITPQMICFLQLCTEKKIDLFYNSMFG